MMPLQCFKNLDPRRSVLAWSILGCMFLFCCSISMNMAESVTEDAGTTDTRNEENHYHYPSTTWTSSSRPPSIYPVDEYIFHARIDHYNFRPTVPYTTFPLRYYVNEEYYNRHNRDGKNHRNVRSGGDDPSPHRQDGSNNNTSPLFMDTTSGPVFFYAGNEADIFQFINNSGFIFEAAKEFNAMVVFAEHRYYGLSNPFGNEYALGKGYNISFLSVEQAMQDYNTLTVHIRQEWDMDDTQAFIVFGGSYGANLALWLRLKNPNLWAGAVASSATPLKHILRETNDFARIETEAYGNVSHRCPDLIRKGWKELFEYAATPSGRRVVATTLSLCGPTLPNEGSAYDIYGWISGALETMVQYGYPYPTTFYNPVPGYPFKVACEDMLTAATSLSMTTSNDEENNGGIDNDGHNDTTSGLRALKAAANVYYNHTGQAGRCFDVDSLIYFEARRHWERKGRYDRLHEQSIRWEQRMSTVVKQKDAVHDTNHMTVRKKDHREEVKRSLSNNNPTIINDGTNSASQFSWTETNRAWGYQTCTEAYQPMPTNGITDFELPYQPNQTEYYQHCWDQWHVIPRPNWEEMTFMGSDIGTGSNIFLTNGQLDPWRAAGIQTVPPQQRRSSCSAAPPGSDRDGTIMVRTLEGAAHHLDLRASHPLDPPSVVQVREEQKEHIRMWIEEWARLHHQ